MPSKVQPIPKGYHSVTPYLVVEDAVRAVDFYQRAFGAKEIMRMATPSGKISHAELQIGDSMLMLSEEMPGSGNKSPRSLGGSPVGIFLYLEDVDSVFNQATRAGAKVEMPLADMFWGDRYGKVVDPFGHSWSLATHKEDVAPEEMKKRAEKAMAEQMKQQAQTVG
jgi:PhnB protein